jgi:hypothetical protein
MYGNSWHITEFLDIHDIKKFVNHWLGHKKIITPKYEGCVRILNPDQIDRKTPANLMNSWINAERHKVIR